MSADELRLWESVRIGSGGVARWIVDLISGRTTRAELREAGLPDWLLEPSNETLIKMVESGGIPIRDHISWRGVMPTVPA